MSFAEMIHRWGRPVKVGAVQQPRLFIVEELAVFGPSGLIRRLFWGPAGFQEFPAGEVPIVERAA